MAKRLQSGDIHNHTDRKKWRDSASKLPLLIPFSSFATQIPTFLSNFLISFFEISLRQLQLYEEFVKIMRHITWLFIENLKIWLFGLARLRREFWRLMHDFDNFARSFWRLAKMCFQLYEAFLKIRRSITSNIDNFTRSFWRSPKIAFAGVP